MTSVINVRAAPEGWQDDPRYVYIGRRMPRVRGDGYFGNPFRLTKGVLRESVMAEFEAYARKRIEEDPEYRQRVGELTGKTLVCWCAPLSCHGDVLARLASELAASG